MEGGRRVVSTDAERKMASRRRAPRRRSTGLEQDDEEDLADHGDPPDPSCPSSGHLQP